MDVAIVRLIESWPSFWQVHYWAVQQGSLLELLQVPLRADHHTTTIRRTMDIPTTLDRSIQHTTPTGRPTVGILGTTGKISNRLVIASPQANTYRTAKPRLRSAEARNDQGDCTRDIS